MSIPVFIFSQPDGWLLGALAAMSIRPAAVEDLFVQVTPGQLQMGAFAVRLCLGGKWKTVVVDDLVPCIGDVPVYGRCRDGSELWVALIEKACAKSAGSYRALEGGTLSDGLRMFAPGITQRLEMEDEEVRRGRKRRRGTGLEFFFF